MSYVAKLGSKIVTAEVDATGGIRANWGRTFLKVSSVVLGCARESCDEYYSKLTGT